MYTTTCILYITPCLCAAYIVYREICQFHQIWSPQVLTITIRPSYGQHRSQTG